LLGGSLNELPGLLDMVRFGAQVTDAETQGEPVTHAGVRKVEPTAGIEAVKQLFVGDVVGAQAETDQVK
jgi:hypothetical protein